MRRHQRCPVWALLPLQVSEGACESPPRPLLHRFGAKYISSTFPWSIRSRSQSLKSSGTHL
eukprot:768357-Hanusia_phi.AAC.4